MVGQEQVHRHLDTALKNFQPVEGSSAWFCALTSTWGGGKTRTADELVSEVTGQSCGWIDRTGTQLPPILQPDFADGILPVMVSYKWIIRLVEEAGRRLPFTAWIPRVSLAALFALKDRANAQLGTVLEHLETFKAPVARAVRDLPRLADVSDESQVMSDCIATMRAHGLHRLLVQVPTKGEWKSCGFGHRVFTLGHHFRHGFGGPPKRMGMLIPFGHKSHQAFRKMLLVRNIGDLQPLPLQDRKPLFDLVHPGAMYGGKVAHKARMFGQPGLHLFALMHPYIIEYHMHRRDSRGSLPVHMLQKSDAFHLPFPLGCRGVDRARARIKTGKEVQGTLADVSCKCEDQ